MNVKRIYYEDLQIARALINRDEAVTRRYFYHQCFPLFKSVYDNYYSDCTSYKEFIDEIYILVMSPSKVTGKCQLENYRGESTLTSWLKTVCLFYCYKKHQLKKKMPEYNSITFPKENDDDIDRNDSVYGSVEIELSGINRDDLFKIIEQMPNKRYVKLIRLRYIEEKTNEETAKELGMSMDNYYNNHKRAKAQFNKIYGKEGER